MLKQNVLTLGLALAPLAGLAPGCDSNDDGTDVIQTVTYSGKLVNGADLSPIEGAEICFVSESTLPCVTTSATGDYSISNIPASKKVEVEVKKAGFLTVISNFVTRDTNFTISAQMFQPEAVALAFTAAGETVDTGKGGLLVRVYDPAVGATQGLAGVKVTIEPKDGIGPFYADGLTFSDGDATTAVGNALFGNLETKSYKVSFESATHTCNGAQLWKTADGRIEAKVKLGAATYLYVDCTKN